MTRPSLIDDAWFEAPQGSAVLASERALVERALAEVFGFVLVQVGAWGPPGALLGAARIPRVLRTDAHDGSSGLRCEPQALPFGSESVDAVVLAHALERSPSPHAVLREAERVLAPDGHMVIVGFHPWSLWGLRRRVGPQRFPFDLPECISEARLRDWLSLLGLRTLAVERHLHGYPFDSAGGLRRGRWLERLGARAWPRFAGGYVLLARKERQMVTPLRVGRERSVPRFPAAVPAARRTGS
jgi:SAM-dependent methyltransferase